MRINIAKAVAIGLSLSSALIGPAAAVENLAFRQSLIMTTDSQDAVDGFYRARSYTAFWTEGNGLGQERLSVLGTALEQAIDHGLPPERFHAGRVEAILSTGHTQADRGRIEAELSALLIEYAKAIDTGLLKPRRIDGNIVRAIPYANPLTYLTGFDANPSVSYFDALAPQSSEYRDLRRAMFALRTEIQAQRTERPNIPGATKPGDQGQAVIALRNALMARGYLRPTVTASYDDDIQQAVLQFQQDHNLSVDGVAGPATIALLNMSREDKLNRILVAMERERWMPEERGDLHIEVNLPDFHARVIEDERIVFETKAIIGRGGVDDQTPEFSDEMDHMVVNPSWNVPRRIATESYLPRLRANSGAVGHLRLVDRSGRTVSRNRSFANYTASNFPYRFVQPPGPRNALGQVKFMFPNPYAIYLHDTPERHLFNTSVRTHSAGCIRLHQPREFAEFLLSMQREDPAGFYSSIRRSGRETTLKLDNTIPVHLIYRTAFSNEYGVIEYRADVYGRDRRMAAALAREGVSAETIAPIIAPVAQTELALANSADGALNVSP